VTVAAPPRRSWTRFSRYRHSLWLLTRRDLKVRYSTSLLGYFWSILDPLVMAAIYWVVFTQIFHRSSGQEPYIVFLLSGLLPWMWFTGAVSDTTRAFLREQKMIRSTKIPRTIWVLRLVLSKGIEFVASIPVVAIFAIATEFAVNPDQRAHLHWEAFYSLLAIALEAILIIGIGLIVAPLVVFFRDLERAVKLILRFLFYASPIVYGLTDARLVRNVDLDTLIAFNPLSGIFSLYRSAFFPEELDPLAIVSSVVLSLLILWIGIVVFRRTIHAVLKEI
jgi:ABC-2 type transport system permease protein